MEEYPDYQVAFSPSPPPYEIVVKGVSETLTRVSQEFGQEMIDWNWMARYHKFYDKIYTIHCITGFELYWEELLTRAEKERNKKINKKTVIIGKELVIDWLKSQIKEIQTW